MAAGFAFLLVGVALANFITSSGRYIIGPGLGLTGVPFLVGLTEFASGRSFVELAQAWDDLRGWQRGLLGLAIVAVATVTIVSVLVVVALTFA